MGDLRFSEELALGPFGRLAAGIWGALWGSFFNVLIIRLPAGESVVRPASHCRSCKAPIPWYDNLPILSFLLLRGRCRRCGARYSGRYLLVEILVCFFSLLSHQHFMVSGHAELGLRLAQYLIIFFFCGILVAVTFIDLDTLRIPDAITYPGIPIAMLLSLFLVHPHLWDGAVGGVAGYLLIRLFADGYHLLTGRMGMGYGDAKLLAMIGGLCGWQALLPTLFLSALQGSLISIPVLLFQRWRERRAVRSSTATATDPLGGPGPAATATDPPGGPGPAADEEAPPLRHVAVPFGPFLCLAALEILFLREVLPSLLFFSFDG
jgi:leader peptidase (prepilin peptidase) / N-methyltransferase